MRARLYASLREYAAGIPDVPCGMVCTCMPSGTSTSYSRAIRCRSSSVTLPPIPARAGRRGDQETYARGSLQNHAFDIALALDGRAGIRL